MNLDDGHIDRLLLPHASHSLQCILNGLDPGLQQCMSQTMRFGLLPYSNRRATIYHSRPRPRTRLHFLLSLPTPPSFIKNPRLSPVLTPHMPMEINVHCTETKTLTFNNIVSLCLFHTPLYRTCTHFILYYRLFF